MGLKAYDFGIYNNLRDYGEERNIVVGKNKKEAKEMYRRYFSERYSHKRGEYTLDFGDPNITTPKEAGVPDKKGVY